MKKRLVPLAALALVATLVPASVTVAAGPVKSVVIEDTAQIGGSGVFVASGPAVEAGWVCASGSVTTFDTSDVVEKNDIVTFTTHKTFTCDGGDELWTAVLDVRLNRRTARTSASWQVDPVVGLEASGNLRGVPIVPGSSILDIYRGRVTQIAP